MSNVVGLILSAALIADTIANLLRLRGVEKAMRDSPTIFLLAMTDSDRS